MRSKYHELVNNCLNFEFQHKYGLNLRTYIEYCESGEKIEDKGKLRLETRGCQTFEKKSEET